MGAEKSSISEPGVRLLLELGLDVLVLEFEITLALWFSFRFKVPLFAFAALILARAIIITTRPIPMIPNAATPPSTHQTAFDFFCGGAAAGIGVHCGGCGWGCGWLIGVWLIIAVSGR